MKGTAMTAQQRDMVDQILRNAPFNLGGDVPAQRPILEQMLTRSTKQDQQVLFRGWGAGGLEP